MSASLSVVVYLLMLVAAVVLEVARPVRLSRVRLQPLRRRALVAAVLVGLLAPVVSPALPAVPLSILPVARVAQAAEVVSAPKFPGVAILPNGQVGILFDNDIGDASELRFKRYVSEFTLETSQLLSNFTSLQLPFYPQLATFQGKVIAAYTDFRPDSPTVNGLLFRVSTNNGATWAAEYPPFGVEQFAGGGSSPLLVTSRDGARLYLFSCCVGNLPQYRFTTDPALASWTTPVVAGDATMRPVSGNNCGASGQECYRAHSFEFTELASGQWLYIAKSDAGFGQSGRGTQVGTLGGSWSAQVDLGGSGGLTGCCGESRATAFLDRNSNVYYVRADDKGENLYFQKSTDGGLSWGLRIYAYSSAQAQYTTGAPVGLYVPAYSRGEYVWFAGVGGIGLGNDQNAVRVIPIWTEPRTYAESGTRRLFGSLGGDDVAPPRAWTLGAFCFRGYGACSEDPVNLATGNFTHQAEDLTLPGRVLRLTFARWYNSSDSTSGPLGPGWTHTFNWTLTDNVASVEIRRGDGRRDAFTRNPDGTYTAPPDTFDELVKNGDGTYTLSPTDQIQYEFSSSGQLSRIHEPAGNQISLGYTGSNLTAITDSVGRLVTLTYDGTNRISRLEDPIGRRVTYAYDANGRLATITDKIGNATGQDPLLHQWRYGYDGTSQRLTTITDPDGRVRVTNTYDSQDRVFEQRDGLNALTTIAYSPEQTVLTDPRSHATTYTFDSRARVLTQSDVVGGSTYTITYAYDSQGNRTSVTDRNGNRTDFTYDARGNVLTRRDPQINPQTPRYVTTYVYDTRNNLTQITDARGFLTTITYDPVTNVQLSMSQQIDAAPTFAVTKWEYNDAANPGLPTRVISPRGNTGLNPNYTYSQTLSYDAQANLATNIDADGTRTTYGYDGAGRQTLVVDPDGNAPGGVPAEHTWRTTYDENDRATILTDPLGSSGRAGYDGSGNRISETDRNGNVTNYVYDGAERLQTIQQKPDPVAQPALVYTTSILRDGNGNPTRVTQANGVFMDYAYDALDRTTSATSHPSPTQALTTTHILDGNGNATARTTADNVTINYAYDALSRLTTVSATGLATITYGYDELGRRTSMVDGTGTSTYQYDGLGRITQAAQPNGTLTYGYDLDSNRTALGYPTVGIVGYAFSPAGRLSTVTDWASRTSSYTYTAAGLAKSLALPNGMTTTYAYDRAQRLTTVVNATASQTISSHAYTLDSEGNRIALDEQLSGIFPSAKVNSDTGTAVQDHPAIAIGADLASYLVWDDARNGNADIFFSKRDAGTDTWGANVKVNTDTGTRLQLNPAISVDASSNAYAVWQDERNSAGQPDIFYRKRNAATEAWGSNLRVDDAPSSTTQRNPRIAGTSAGAETSVWVDLRQSQKNIYSSQLAAGGSSWSTPNKRVTDNTSAVKDFPDVAVGSNGTAYVVWQDSRSGNADIFFSSLAAGGSAWAANVKISDDPGTAAQRLPKVGIDTAGNLTVAWIDDRTTPSKVRAVRRPAGGSWSSSVVVSDAQAKPQSLALSVRSDSYAWATWGDTRASSQDIWGSRYDPHTNSWSAPVRLDDDPGTSAAQSSPTVAFTSSETMLAWRDNRLSANGDSRARRAVFVPGLSEHFSYTYDGLNRLKMVTGPLSESFVLDGASNITSRTGPPATNSYDQANRQIADGSQTYVWSDADRLTQRGSDAFTYDPLDRLTSSSVGGSFLDYSYDGDGLLVRARLIDPCPSPCAGPLAPIFPTTTFLWDPSSEPAPLLQVTSSAGGDNIIYGLGPLYYALADGSTLTMARDGGKSIRAEVNAGGGVATTFRYRAYGEIAQASGNRLGALGYAGQLFDSSGLYYMRARWYDAAAGRFVSQDPASPAIAAPATQNRFGYGSANPIARIDPSGLDDMTLDPPPCGPFAMKLGDCTTNPVLASHAWMRQYGVIVTPSGVMILFARKDSRSEAEQSARKKPPFGPGGPPKRHKLSKGEIKWLETHHGDVHSLKQEIVGRKNVARYEVYKDPQGNLFVHLRGGGGEGEPANINIYEGMRRR